MKKFALLVAMGLAFVVGCNAEKPAPVKSGATTATKSTEKVGDAKKETSSETKKDESVTPPTPVKEEKKENK
jgi:hypothetical protein